MVRLQAVFCGLNANSAHVSIPKWCDCKSFAVIASSISCKFQFQNGAIARLVNQSKIL